jgi:hypothetical protein
MQLQAVAEIVEPNAMAKLGVQQTYRVTPGTERARLILNASLSRYLGDGVFRNQIANLAQDVKSVACWLDCFLFHPRLVAGLDHQANTFSNFLWDGCDYKCKYRLPPESKNH